MTEHARPEPASSPAVKKEDVKNDVPGAPQDSSTTQTDKEVSEKELEKLSGGLLRLR